MRVGTSLPNLSGVLTLRDHPHACGDKKRNYPHLWGLKGSSPCVWGQEWASSMILAEDRIIPMRVGTSIPPVKRVL